MNKTFVIWDWNGTIVDDVDAAVNALNRMLALRGIPPTTRSFYRQNFRFPVRPFYADVGINLDREDWDRICIDFHRFIAEEPQRLRPDATAALAHLQSRGVRQSILSALRQDILLADSSRLGVAPFFTSIFGVDNLDGATKLSRGRELFAALAESHPDFSPANAVFIGDTLHDAEVARSLGARAILVDGGHQTPERLQSSGFPVLPSLLSAAQSITP